MGEETSETSWTYMNCKAIFCCHHSVLLVLPATPPSTFPKAITMVRHCSLILGTDLLTPVHNLCYCCVEKKLGNYMNCNVDHCIDFLSEGEMRLN